MSSFPLSSTCYQNSHSGRSDAPPWMLKSHFRFLPVSRMTFFVAIPALQHVLTLTTLTSRIETVCCARPKLALATSTSSRSWPLYGVGILSHSGSHSSLPASPPLCSHIMWTLLNFWHSAWSSFTLRLMPLSEGYDNFAPLYKHQSTICCMCRSQFLPLLLFYHQHISVRPW